ncbi:MAG TPA: hypothetical protein VLK84_32450 [Longimicrobium sp.]|nr:hypothetical protein [Longimicrobium sp.]
MKFVRWMTVTAAWALAACAPAATSQTPAPGPVPAAGQPATGQPAGADPAALAASAARATVPASPRQVNFQWELDEAGARFRGRGVGRMVAPSRFRLDLFGPRGETYLAAALVDGEARVPPALIERFRLPSPALLWATVGIIAPPADARLLSAAPDGAVTVLRYQLGDDVLEYRTRDGRLQTVRRSARGGTAESIDLEYDATGLASARYRDWAAYRTLNLTLESATDVPSFPESTWTPPGA